MTIILVVVVIDIGTRPREVNDQLHPRHVGAAHERAWGCNWSLAPEFSRRPVRSFYNCLNRTYLFCNFVYQNECKGAFIDFQSTFIMVVLFWWCSFVVVLKVVVFAYLPGEHSLILKCTYLPRAVNWIYIPLFESITT